MIRPSLWRTAVLLVTLVAASATLGLPARPRLLIGEVSAPVMTRFIADGLRLILTVLIWYLIAATILSVAARVPKLGTIARPLADRLVAVGLATALRRVMATSVVVGVAMPAAAGAQSVDADEVPVMVPIEPQSDPAPTARTSAPTDDPPVMTRHPRPAPGPATPAAPVPRSPVPESTVPDPTVPRPTVPSSDRAPAASLPRPPVPAERHTVQAGESFWTIAEELEQSRGGEASLARVAATWQRLVDRNADGLVDPGNPDLLHVGQVIELS